MIYRATAALLVAPGLLGTAAAAQAQTDTASSPLTVRLDSVDWRPSGDGLEIAIIEGSPRTEGEMFTMLLRLQDGAWIGPRKFVPAI